VGGDPFDFPQSIVPKGMAYQWCAKTVMGDPNPSFTKMLEGGWSPVPAHRHRSVFAKRVDGEGNVAFGGQVLMCRLEEASQEAQQLNEDKAFQNAAATGRLLKFGDVTFRLSENEMASAKDLGVSCQQYALRRMRRMADGLDQGTCIVGIVDHDYGPTGSLEFHHQARRLPRHRWLSWLFNLISKEQ